MLRIENISDVVAWRLCLGCGACAYACPDRVRLVDYLREGIRPVVDTSACGDCRVCLEVCPAVATEFPGIEADDGKKTSFTKEWGPVLALWEGHAADPTMRFEGSSGGVLTALAAYCLEVLGMSGVLHVGADLEDPVRNRTRLSRSREELLAAAGSRYSPGSVCNGLQLVQDAPRPCVVIGRPVEIAALRKAQKLRPELDRKVGVALSFFCAESPSTSGTLQLLEKLGVDAKALASLRYRGRGWPGHFAPVASGETSPRRKLTYRESWSFLQSFRSWSTHLWPDGGGELADISCGDPWYREPDGNDPGSSLVVARTLLGRKLVEGAIAAGYLSLTPAELWKLEKSQAGLLAKKSSVWGRRLALRAFRLPVTRFCGLDLGHCWWRLPMFEKLRSTVGTVRRIIARKFYKRLELCVLEGIPVKPARAEESLLRAGQASGSNLKLGS